MKILLLALIIVMLFWVFSIPFVIRANARNMADHIIFGRQPSTEKQINKCISILTWTNKQITTNTEKDTLRLIQLRDLLKEMQHPHG